MVQTAQPKPRLGISTCLLGEPVRHDGGHKRQRFLTDTLGQYVDWVPVCPEVECGLPTPRRSMRLVGNPDRPRLVVTKTGQDKTDQMQDWARQRLKALERENLVGFIFKANSPSSGMERVRVYNPSGMPRKVGVGIFARAFMEHFPLLPVEEEGRLHDPGLRENFIERIFLLQRYRQFKRGRLGLAELIEFHSQHKLQLMAYSPSKLKQMGQLVAKARRRKPDVVWAEYETLLLQSTLRRPTTSRQVNVLQHVQGYFKKQLSADEKQEFLEVIERYRAGLIPLVVPITLIQHFVRKHRPAYLLMQSYLNPHPLELKLRNHA